MKSLCYKSNIKKYLIIGAAIGSIALAKDCNTIKNKVKEFHKKTLIRPRIQNIYVNEQVKELNRRLKEYIGECKDYKYSTLKKEKEAQEAVEGAPPTKPDKPIDEML